MKLARVLLAAPVVLQVVAAEIPHHGVVRWHPRQEATSAASASATGAAPTEKETTTTSAQPTTTSAAPTTSSTTAAQTTRTTEAQTSTTQSVQSQSTPTSSSTTPTPQSTSSTQQQQQPTSAPAQESTFSMSTLPPTSSQVVATDGSGKVITSFVIVTPSPTSVLATPSATAAASKSPSQGTIIGLAVTGSIAGLIVILLIVWKLTNKRFSDLDDTGDDAIKWPELNKDSAAMTPLPARPTGRAGVETNALDDFDRQSAAHSTVDLQYQPYSDDPGYAARPAYYDPYGGAGQVKPYASPPGSHDGDHKKWGVQPDGQYYDPPRGASPGPNLAYGDSIGRGASPGPNLAYGDSMARGVSPAPPMAYADSMGRGASPAPPNMAYADPLGRTGSPGPMGYGGYPGGYAPDPAMVADPYGGRHSPGPNLAYGAPTDAYGRRSPGPGLAYGGAAGRVGSPGPNAAGGYR